LPAFFGPGYTGKLGDPTRAGLSTGSSTARIRYPVVVVSLTGGAVVMLVPNDVDVGGNSVDGGAVEVVGCDL
jgi:hypothetical protein